jgi:sodium/hydrogen antiporter
MNTPALFAVALGIFAFALISRRAEAGMVTAPMVFTAFGYLMGSAVLGIVEPQLRSTGVQAVAEITLVVALFTDAARIDLRRLGREHDVPMRLLGIGLPLTVVAGTGLAMLMFPDLGLWPAALIGVILAPTDAALGQAVVSDTRVPQRVRQGLNVESGLNDGLAFPALLLVASLAGSGGAEDMGVGANGTSAAGWAAFITKQLVLGPLVGAAAGLGGTVLIERASARHWMNEIFLRISTLSLAILAFTGAELAGGNGYIAAFVGGLVVGTRSRTVLDGVEDFGETEGQLLTLLVFLLFGAVLLPDLGSLGWRHVLYAALSLTLVRMVPVALALFGTRLTLSTVLFLGWFGPRGLASIIYLLLVIESGAVASTEEIQRVVFLTVVLSIAVHGASAAPLAGRYGRRMKALDAAPEHRRVFPFPTRMRSTRQKAQEQPSDRTEG